MDLTLKTAVVPTMAKKRATLNFLNFVLRNLLSERIADIEMKFSRTFPGKPVRLLSVVDPQGADGCAVPDPWAARGTEVSNVDFL